MIPAVCFQNANINKEENNKMNKTHNFILVPFENTVQKMQSSALKVVISMHSIVFVLKFIAFFKKSVMKSLDLVDI